MRQRTKDGAAVIAEVGRYRIIRYDALNLALERRDTVTNRKTKECREEWISIGYYGKFLPAGERWLDLLMFDKLTDLDTRDAVAAFREEATALRHALARAAREGGGHDA